MALWLQVLDTQEIEEEEEAAADDAADFVEDDEDEDVSAFKILVLFCCAFQFCLGKGRPRLPSAYHTGALVCYERTPAP